MSSKITPDELTARVARALGLTAPEIKGRGHLHELVRARWICWKLLELAGYSRAGTGRLYGRDHTTIISALKKFNLEMRKSPKHLAVYESLLPLVPDIKPMPIKISGTDRHKRRAVVAPLPVLAYVNPAAQPRPAPPPHPRHQCIRNGCVRPRHKDFDMCAEHVQERSRQLIADMRAGKLRRGLKMKIRR